MSFSENRKPKTENRLFPFRYRTGPKTKSFEIKKVYPLNATGPKRHKSGTISGFSQAGDTESLPRPTILGALTVLKGAVS